MSSNGYLETVFNNNNEIKWKFPYEIRKVDPDLNKQILKDFTGERTGFVQVGPKKYFFPEKYASQAEIFYNFQTRPGDVFVVTFPRSGTTWTQEMVWLLENNLNFEKARNVLLCERFPFLEYSCFVHKDVKQELLDLNKNDRQKFEIIQSFDYPAWKILEETEGPRFVKTHLPFSLLPPNILNTGCKVIYIARHPKDVVVSFYHLNRTMRTQGFVGDFPKYWHYFKNNLQPWTPYWEHIKEAWSKRNEDNFLFLFYDDLNKDLLSGIKKVAKFLNKQYSDEELAPLIDHLKIETFRKNPAVNSEEMRELKIIVDGEASFVRKGKSGGWKDYFVDKLNVEADEWIKDNLKGTDLVFPGLNIN